MAESLPTPATDQAYCNVSALEGGFIDLRSAMFIDDGETDEVITGPCLAFLLSHSTTGDKFVFDLGTRKDWENYPPVVVRRIHEVFHSRVPQDAIESLQKGGLSPSEVDVVCLSHVHWDHIGDTRPFINSTFLVGGSSKPLFSPGYPGDPDSGFASDLLPEGRTRFIDMKDGRTLGPFPRALDYYGDGSLYITDAAGHLPGHINVVARTSADGGWILLGGDSAHHWRLVTGASKIAVGVTGGCAHLDVKAAEENLIRIRAFMDLPRTRVILAHDVPWFEENKGGPGFWPGKIQSK